MADSVHTSPRERWGVLRMDAALLIAGRITAAACGLIQVPVALATLGAEQFGIWVALTGILWTVASLDGGIGFALQNRMAHALAQGAPGTAARFIREGRRWLWLAGALTATAGALLAGFGNWTAWLRIVDTTQIEDLRVAVAVAFLAAALVVPLSLSSRIAAALQQTWLIGLWTAIGSLVGLAAVITAAALGASLVGFMLASALFPLLGPLGTWLHLRVRGDLPLRGQAPLEPMNANALARESASLFIPQLGAAFLGSFVPTLVAFFAGPTAAAAYGVLQRLYGIVLQLQVLGLQPTWPAYTHAAARNDHDAIARIFRTSTVATVVSVLVVLVVIVPLTPQILRVWLGDNAPPIPLALLWAVALWHVVQCVGQPAALLLNGTGRAHVVAISSSIGIVVSLLLCAWWGRSWGGPGVIAALAVPYVVLNLPMVAWHARRTLAAMQPGVRPA